MSEVWKYIEGHEKYEVSNLGNVRKNTKRYGTHLCKTQEKERGCGVSIDGVIMQVGRLVAEAFIPNPLNYEIVVHKDGDYNNNRVENLQWDSRANRYERTDSKFFKAKGVIAFYNEKGELVNIFRTIKQAADETHKSKQAISHIICGRAKITKEGWRFERLED